MPRAIAAAVTIVMLIAPARAQELILDTSEPQPALRVRWRDGRQLRFTVTAELGSRPLSRWVSDARVLDRTAGDGMLQATLALGEGYRLRLRAERYAGAVRVQSLLERTRGEPETAYYY
ncbi:MAG: hypothetical protein ACP5KN_17360, partial [Armatimonadota bacterium]